MTVTAPFLVYAKGIVPIDATIKRNGVAVDLTAKTVTATVRKIADWDTLIDAALEDISTTVVDATAGIVQVLVNASLLTGNPRKATDGIPYGIQFYVEDDLYYPELLIIGVRDAN